MFAYAKIQIVGYKTSDETYMVHRLSTNKYLLIKL